MGRGVVQPELQVSEPGDALEQEADRVAEAVMRMNASAMRSQGSPPAVQRNCGGCAQSLQQGTEELVQRDALDEEEVLQPKRNTGQRAEAMPFPGRGRPMLKSGCACGGGCSGCCAAPVVPMDDRPEREADQVADRVMREAALARGPPLASVSASAIEMQAGRGDGREGRAGALEFADLPWRGPAHAGGEPLSPELRAFYEPRFGRDFSGVRLHHGPAAGVGARALGARAYAFGRDIAFAPGEFRPGSIAGRRLIAHELAHVAQQGRAPPIGGRARAGAVAPGQGLARISRRIQRACGPGEIGSPPECEQTTGDIFGTPFRFRVDCDLFAAPSEEERLRDAAGLIGHGRTNVHGFASTEGGEDYNYNLSCSRAHVAAAILRSHGVDVVKLFAHGGTPGPAADRRSVVLEPLATPMPVPTPEPPAPEPEPEAPEPESSDCGTFQSVMAAVLNVEENVIAEALECFCEVMKIGDVVNSLFSFIPDSVAAVIEIGDCLCGIWDFLQLVWELGTPEGACFNVFNIEGAGVARLVALGIFLASDCGADLLDNFVNYLISSTEESAIELGGTIGSFEGALLVFGIYELIKRLVESWGEAVLDLISYMSQNEITHGTPFPLDGCRSCFRLPYYFGASDYSSICDELNDLLVPDLITFPEVHGEPTDWGAGEGASFWGE